MSKINLSLPDDNIVTGKQVSFIAPCGSDSAECLTINGVDYIVCNAIGVDVAGTTAWASGVIVSVILNVEETKAYIQNAATSAGESTAGTLTAISITESADGTVTMVNTLDIGTETIVISADAEGNPNKLTYNGNEIPCEWVVS